MISIDRLCQLVLESALIESWQYLSLSDKRYIIREYGSFGQWMDANLKCFIILKKEKPNEH